MSFYGKIDFFALADGITAWFVQEISMAFS